MVLLYGKVSVPILVGFFFGFIKYWYQFYLASFLVLSSYHICQNEMCATISWCAYSTWMTGFPLCHCLPRASVLESGWIVTHISDQCTTDLGTVDFWILDSKQVKHTGSLTVANGPSWNAVFGLPVASQTIGMSSNSRDGRLVKMLQTWKGIVLIIKLQYLKRV